MIVFCRHPRSSKSFRRITEKVSHPLSNRVDDIIRRVIRNRVYTKVWRSVEVLVVDEVSMMSSKMIDLLDQIGRIIRKVNKPFGGIQLVFTGDFFQLPPIKDQDDPTSGEFCFQNPKWGKMFIPDNCIELKIKLYLLTLQNTVTSFILKNYQ